MPGLLSPHEAAPLRISVPETADSQIRRNADDSELRNPKIRSPAPKKALSPSPSSSSRAKPSPERNSSSGKRRSLPALEKPHLDDLSLDNPDLGPFLLKLARDTIASGEGPVKALEYAIRASKSFEKCAVESGDPSLGLAMSLHVTGAIYCSLGRYEEAVPVLERAVAVPDVARGPEHALAAFSGYMQLGDTQSMLGRIDQSIECYSRGLEIQIEALGDSDPRVAETCRYLAEAHVQAMQFDEAEKLCQKTLEIHREHSAPASMEEAADRRLMAIICDAKGDYDAALEHLVLASMAMIANGHDGEVASIDVSIGNTYLALGRYDEAVFSYQKALTVMKSTKGDNHTSVALVFVRLADLYYRTGKLRESKSYCENALRIYAKPVPGTAPEDIAGGLMEIASLYEALEEPEEALKLLQKGLKLLEDVLGQWSTVAGIEAQMGVMYYIVGRYGDSRNSFENAVAKLRAIGEKKSVFFGMVLNQMGLACVQLFKIDEAAELFEESKGILEQEYGTDHQDTLGVYSNLAATYDAMGRVEDSIELLEHVLKVREERLGTANPDVEEERRRLTELLKEAGRSRSRKQKSLENLIVSTSQKMKKEVTKRWPSLGFKS
ncbi:polypeptide N-acetylglucosaminyltransferase [Apostasia shenzhenica]|uniref:Polypeptide N-acetylglucosaminyltransferase n=1 Tax=Apostasia shenzhenica TaxID=1088818 RepID=A0A2I0ACT3_9ASPA|nr:polypeptide N-acetylglucosaminyltransferase [Apostasia shenzhenica]